MLAFFFCLGMNSHALAFVCACLSAGPLTKLLTNDMTKHLTEPYAEDFTEHLTDHFMEPLTAHYE